MDIHVAMSLHGDAPVPELCVWCHLTGRTGG